jgi:hypothetical protein
MVSRREFSCCVTAALGGLPSLQACSPTAGASRSVQTGGSNGPHLHIHAQRPGPPGAPMGGEPLPMLFDGRFLVRGKRIELP